MKTTRAKNPKASKVLRKEKGSLFGDHVPLKHLPKKPSVPAIGKQFGQAHLAPKHKKI